MRYRLIDIYGATREEYGADWAPTEDGRVTLLERAREAFARCAKPSRRSMGFPQDVRVGPVFAHAWRNVWGTDDGREGWIELGLVIEADTVAPHNRLHGESTVSDSRIVRQQIADNAERARAVRNLT